MKIPEHAKRVFKGEIFDVYQWEEKNYDGSMSTWERVKRVASVLVIPVVGDKVCLAYEEQPGRPLSLQLLGGRAEEHEEPLMGAKRELLEEAGMESDDWELLREYNESTGFDWPVYIFIARDCKRVNAQQLDPGERIEVKEYTFEDFITVASSEDFGSRQIADFLFRIAHNPEKKKALRAVLFKET